MGLVQWLFGTDPAQTEQVNPEELIKIAVIALGTYAGVKLIDKHLGKK